MVGIMKLMLAGVPIMVLGMAHTGEGLTSDSSGPEKTIRTFVRANAEKDLATLSHLMAYEGNITNYTFRWIHLDDPLAQRSASTAPQHLVGTVSPSDPDLSGEWEILEVEDDKRYTATLDKAGNGPYTQHGGRFVTTKFSDRLWQGTWQQPGNDREGGFEVLLSEDGTQANGVWWYSRVGAQKNIPPREHGGTYSWKRLTPPPTAR